MIDERLLDIGRLWREGLLLSALTGAVVGLLVAGFEWVTAHQLLPWLLRLPLVVQAAGPMAGLLLRTGATAATLAGGGAGGVFIPLVLFGMLTGHLVSGVIDEAPATLFPLVGAAAFLGAGYRTPLAAVVFVAESTGQAGFIVPTLLAAAVSQLVMGKASVSLTRKPDSWDPSSAGYDFHLR